MGADSNKDITDPDRGNIVIRAQNIDIDNVMDVYTNQSEQKFKQTGLTVSVSNSLVDNVNAIRDLEEAAGNTGSTRMKGIAAISGLLKAQALAEQAQETLGSIQNGVGNTRIQATIGSQKSQSNSSSYTEKSQGSSIDTNNLALIATGAGSDSNININGSSLTVSNDALFQADNDLNVNGVAQNSNTRSNNKSSSTAIGGYASFGQNTSAGITASASRGKGHANSDSTTYANSQINVGSTTTFDIGNDVNIKGGIINTNRAQGQIGGDVNIESLQDTATYDSKQKNMGFSADIDIAGGGAGSSLSVNGGKTDLNADYQAVGEQSGIFTGDGGIDLTAGGKTTLIGGAITTTDAALQAGLNNYVSKGGIETQDINNTTSYDGNAIQAGLSLGDTTGKPQANLNGLGYGTDSDSDSSVTRAGITGIAGSQDITTDNRAEYAGILKNSFNAGRVNEELGAQTQITQEFGKEAPKAVAEFSQNRINAIKANPDLSIDKKLTAIAKWDEGGIYRVAAHTALGALGTGSVEGTLTAGGVAAAAPTLNDVQAKLAKALTDKGMNADIANGTASGVISLTLLGTGAAAGLDTSSTVTATSIDANNRQLHPEKGEYWVVEQLYKPIWSPKMPLMSS
ncbi:hemagglutinin repeat-containing protein [Psychrobacter submarinus]|uniref:hemagglutinin repeat-containing protein n=1 Tax=Psychrobacter submarinus TaxID=154108 RepID=UPI00191A8FC8|nr:hemagglutinin repeat-containing protein [Psychrobacter submarinus]